jgi:hypothetical protein
MKSQSETTEALKTLLESLASSNVKVTITIEPNGGLSGSQVEEARRAGRENSIISFAENDNTNTTL